MNNIVLDVGGYKINIENELVNKSNILQKFIQLNFIDMDPTIFMYILHVIKNNNTNTYHHKKYNNILVHLNILNKNLYIEPKIIIPKKINYNNPDKFDIIKINIRGKRFKTFKQTIVKSNFLLKNLTKDNNIFLDKDYKSFSYILNLLRNDEICFFPREYLQELDLYEIQYYISNKMDNKLENINNKLDILYDTYNNNKTNINGSILQINSNNTKLYQKELKNILSKYKVKTNLITNENNIHSYTSANQYFTIKPSYSLLDNNIDKNIDIDYGKTIIFEIDKNGDLIDDISVIIDLAPLYKGMWVNNLGNILIRRIYFNLNNETIINIPGNFLDIKKKLYLKNGKAYNSLDISYDNDFDGEYISRKNNRIIIPLHINEKIPIGKENVKLICYIELENKNTCIIDYIDNCGGDIINLSLLINYINLSVEKDFFIKNTNLYIYNTIKVISQNITHTNDINYNLTNISLNNFQYIKDIIIVIHLFDNLNNKKYFDYCDCLLEAELIIDNNILFKLDKNILNKYIPLKYFKKKPDSNGIYYYTFTTKPKSNKLFGGININNDVIINLKTNKVNGIIHIYSNNYLMINI